MRLHQVQKKNRIKLAEVLDLKIGLVAVFELLF